MKLDGLITNYHIPVVLKKVIHEYIYESYDTTASYESMQLEQVYYEYYHLWCSFLPVLVFKFDFCMESEIQQRNKYCICNCTIRS